MPSLVNIDTEFSRVPLSSSPSPSYMVGASYFNVRPVGVTAVASVVAGSGSIFIPYFVHEDHDFDAFSMLFATGTSNTEFSVYTYDETGLKLGTKIEGGTSGATPTLDIFTDITFTATSFTKGWHWIGFSGVGNNGSTLYSGEQDTGVNTENGFLGFGVDGGAGGLSNFFDQNSFYKTASRLAAVSPGDALTSTTAAVALPFIGLRAV